MLTPRSLVLPILLNITISITHGKTQDSYVVQNNSNDHLLRGEVSTSSSHTKTNEDERHVAVENHMSADRNSLAAENAQIQLTLCVDRCAGDCISFRTPINECFNGQTLFPKERDAWGEFDVYDEVKIPSESKSARDELSLERRGRHRPSFTRYFFGTLDSTCDVMNTFDGQIDVSYATERYDLPFDECVGPFGAPRPWGKFELVYGDNMDIDFNIE